MKTAEPCGSEALVNASLVPSEAKGTGPAWEQSTFARSDRPASWYSKACGVLDQLYGLRSNWDSYGADAVAPESIEQSRQLLTDLAYVVSVPEPVVTATPDGHVGMCWDTGAWSLDLEVSPTGLISFVYLDESDPRRERESKTRSLGELIALLTQW